MNKNSVQHGKYIKHDLLVKTFPPKNWIGPIRCSLVNKNISYFCQTHGTLIPFDITHSHKDSHTLVTHTQQNPFLSPSMGKHVFYLKSMSHKQGLWESEA